MKYLPLVLLVLLPQIAFAASSDTGFWDTVMDFVKTWGGRLGLLGFVWSISLIVADYFFDWDWLSPIVAKHKRKLFFAIMFFGVFALASTFIQEIIDFIKDPFQNLNL